MSEKTTPESFLPTVAGSPIPDASFETILAHYLVLHESGEAPQPDAYIANYPHVAEELKSFFRNRHWMEGSSAETSPLKIGTFVGSYRIEAELARGGMGVIYRATQQGLNRPVALKLIRSGLLASDEERRRFRREAEAAAQLHHPGIVPIYEIGQWQGYDFFSMALIDGPTLQQQIDAGAIDDRESARILRDVARATAFAHRNGVVHRDLKPENILMEEGMRPVIADFGLAKWQPHETMLTRTGQVLGTPHYMSPEQASGRSDCDQTSDVYSLGSILYCLTTGRPPHIGSSVGEVLRCVMQDDPPEPRTLRRSIPHELEQICLQAMHYEPNQRYVSADAFADDLDHFLRGEPITATGRGLIHRVARELHRDQHQESFANWGRTLQLMGLVIFLTHLMIQGLQWTEFPPLAAYWGPRSVMMLLLAGLIYHSRNGKLMPRSSAERPVWSIWIGYLATLGVMNLMIDLKDLDPITLFPVASALSGFGFLAMAGHVWGGCALLGALFLGDAILMTVTPATAPIQLGLLWLSSLVVLGRRYRS
jgi:serine/threonine-protein kinase